VAAMAQTNYNAATGIGAVWNVNGSILRSLNAEFAIAGYTSMKSDLSALKRGAGDYYKIAARLRNFALVVSYWECRNYISLFGSPFYGAVSTKFDGMQFLRPQMLYFGADYVRPLAKGFSLAVNADVFYYVSGRMYSTATGEFQTPPFGNNANFTFGITMKINPSFFLRTIRE